MLSTAFHYLPTLIVVKAITGSRLVYWDGDQNTWHSLRHSVFNAHHFSGIETVLKFLVTVITDLVPKTLTVQIDYKPKAHTRYGQVHHYMHRKTCKQSKVCVCFIVLQKQKSWKAGYEVPEFMLNSWPLLLLLYISNPASCSNFLSDVGMNADDTNFNLCF